MLDKVVVFTKKRALTIVFICALVLFLMILAKWLIAYRNNDTGLSTAEGRESFLNGLGDRCGYGGIQKRRSAGSA